MDHGRSEGRLMYEESIDHFADFAQGKVSALKHNPVGFFVGAMMAGAYVGFGIILISFSAATQSPKAKN
jgi:nitrite transporter NirC